MTHMSSGSRGIAVIAAILLAAGRSSYGADATPPVTPGGCSSVDVSVCKGDCDTDHRVTVNELIACLNIALGTLRRSACYACEDPNGVVTIESILSVVNNALFGCPVIAPTPTPCSTPVCTGAVLPPLCIPFDDPCSCYCEATPVPTPTPAPLNCRCLANGGHPSPRGCPCDVQSCYQDCVEDLCPSFPQCTLECSLRCTCEANYPQCPTHEDPGPTPYAWLHEYGDREALSARRIPGASIAEGFSVARLSRAPADQAAAP